MSYLKKISQQTSWQILGKVVTSLSTILVLSLVTRNYGESGTGVFTLVLTYLAFFYLAADFGINAHILQVLQDSKQKTQNEFRRLLGLRLVWSVVLIILSVAITPLLPFNNLLFSQSVLFGALAIIGSSIFVTANAVFQSNLRYDLSIIASSLGMILSLTIIALMILNHLPIPYLVFGHMVGWMLVGLLSLFLAKRFVGLVTPILDLGHIKSTLKDVWPISLTLVLNVVYFRVDSFILTSYRSFSDVGVYNLAYQIFQSALVLPTFIMNAYYPLMFNQFKQNLVLFRKTLIKACLLMLGLSVVGMLVSLIASPLLVSVLTGSKGFSGSIVSLQILSLSFPAFFLSSVLMWTMVTVKKYKQMVFIYLVGLVVNLSLNLIFIPRYSYIAASVVTGISEYLILLLQVLILFKLWKK